MPILIEDVVVHNSSKNDSDDPGITFERLFKSGCAVEASGFVGEGVLQPPCSCMLSLTHSHSLFR